MWIFWFQRLRPIPASLRAAFPAALGGAFTTLVALHFCVGLALPFADSQTSERAIPAAPAWDARFVPLGRAYLPALGRVYAAAWLKGADALQAGQPVEAALGQVSQAWESGRQALFDRLVTPEFHRIVPEGRDNASVTIADKQAMARCWRGFALGLDPKAK